MGSTLVNEINKANPSGKDYIEHLSKLKINLPKKVSHIDCDIEKFERKKLEEFFEIDSSPKCLKTEISQSDYELKNFTVYSSTSKFGPWIKAGEWRKFYSLSMFAEYPVVMWLPKKQKVFTTTPKRFPLRLLSTLDSIQLTRPSFSEG